MRFNSFLPSLCILHSPDRSQLLQLGRSLPVQFSRMVDAMITIFHLPKSTLLALVAAIAGLENILAAYRHAIEQRYRFYSYGDAMLIV